MIIATILIIESIIESGQNQDKIQIHTDISLSYLFFTKHQKYFIRF